MQGDSSGGSLRDSFQRWNEGRNSGGSGSESFVEGAKSAITGWMDSIGERAQDAYQRLPLTQQDVNTAGNGASSEPAWFVNMSRAERFVFFLWFIAVATVCFSFSLMLFPVLAVKPRKFGLLWSVGSLMFVMAFGVLQGPYGYTRHLISAERLPFTVFFFGSCLLTIYFSAFMKSTWLTIPCAVLELIAVVYYVVSYFPFGASGLRMVSAAGMSTARGALRI